MVSVMASSSTIRSLCVCGSGQMGAGIACVATYFAKCSVNLFDSNSNALQKGYDSIAKFLRLQVARGKCTQEDADDALSRVNMSQSLQESAADVDFCIEAVTESLPVKKNVISEMAGIVKPETIIASNTSSIPISMLAPFAGSAAPRLVGLHFFNPANIQRGVEVIASKETSQNTFGTAWKFAIDLGKVPCRSKDVPGFLANRILTPMVNDAVSLLEKGIGDRDSIDNIMKYGCNMPIGPLALADLVGIDTVVNILEQLEIEPSKILKDMVKSGSLGRKSGKGFYKYSAKL